MSGPLLTYPLPLKSVKVFETGTLSLDFGVASLVKREVRREAGLFCSLVLIVSRVSRAGVFLLAVSLPERQV
jgi:hypothetical protein